MRRSGGHFSRAERLRSFDEHLVDAGNRLRVPLEVLQRLRGARPDVEVAREHEGVAVLRERLREVGRPLQLDVGASTVDAGRVKVRDRHVPAVRLGPDRLADAALERPA